MKSRARRQNRRCIHRRLELLTEGDRCTWVKCSICGKVGPRKHSVTLALMGWLLRIANQHPRINARSTK